MKRHFCKILVDSDAPWMLRLEIEDYWSRHDIIMHAIRRGYLTRDEADCARNIERHWSNYLPRDYFKLDRSPYQWKEITDVINVR